MGGDRLRDAVAAFLIVTVTSIVLALPQFDVLRGLSIDVLTGLRWSTYGELHKPAESPAVVIGIDEDTYRTPPFENTPNVTWTREIGKVLTATIQGGAKVVGFDIVFPTSIEQSEIPFGDETLGARVRGFDRDFLRALNAAARDGKVVLGQVQHSEHPIRPGPGQRIAVGQQRNIRPLNSHNDPDDIIRRVPVTLDIDGTPTPSLSVELAARALGVALQKEPDGTYSLGGYRIPEAVPNTVTLNFDGGANDIPTFSLADLHACAEKGDTAYFKRHFDGRVVLIGTVLDVEDRKLTSKRLATGVEGTNAPRCVLPPPAASGKFQRDSISGVYIHATAVNNLLRHEALIELGRWWNWSAGFGFASIAAAAALTLSPIGAMVVFLVAAFAWAAAAVWTFLHMLVLPLIDPILAGLAAGATTIAYRFIVSDKDKRLLRKTFALYLAPAVIEKMMASHKPPELGGETRQITVYFSDIAGFSSFSEKLEPKDLVDLMIEYLSAMSDIIEAHGGFVDKYIGDAIVAVFGAPLNDPAHALNAVRAALKCRDKLEELNRTSRFFKGFKLSQRIGLNSGEALVGNIGSRRRFNYTVMGDTVNLASRLEGANKYFSTAIMASETTAMLAGRTIAWRELDAIRVKGRATPVKILEPLGAAGQESTGQKEIAGAYAEGLACWRARDFAGAMESFARVAEQDPPSALFMARAQKYAFNPPGDDWEPVNTLEEK